MATPAPLARHTALDFTIARAGPTAVRLLAALKQQGVVT